MLIFKKNDSSCVKKRNFKSGLLLAAIFTLSAQTFAAPVSAPVFQQLKRADSLIAKKSYGQAEKTLRQRLKRRNSGYERAVLLRSLSSVYGAQKNYPEAIGQLKKSLATRALPYGAKQKAQLTLGQYYLANRQQDEAWAILEPWAKRNKNPRPKTAMMLANLFSQHKKYGKALALVKKAIATTANPPKEWMDMQLALGYKTKDYAAAIAALKEKLNREPDNKAHWQQLATAYHNAEDYTQAASLLHLAYQRGFLKTEAELLDLAKVFLYAKTPYKAAQFLNQQFEKNALKKTATSLELLGNAWLQAKEQETARQALEGAFKLEETASISEKLAKIYARQKKWQAALDAFNKTLKLGGFKLQGDSQLLLGITYYYLQDMEQAESAFEAALLHKEQKNIAQQWLGYLKTSAR